MRTRDLFATILDYVGLGDVPANDTSPSRSFAPLLKGERLVWEDELFIEQEETRAIRTSKWLYMKRFKGSQQHPFEDELYDVVNDPLEKTNLIAEPDLADVAESLSARIEAFFQQYSSPKYDLWQGGTAKSNSDKPWLWQDAWGDDWKSVFK